MLSLLVRAVRPISARSAPLVRPRHGVVLAWFAGQAIRRFGTDDPHEHLL